jgi:AcrR family transcriptional regulator
VEATPAWKARPEGAEYESVRGRLVDAAETIVREEGVNALRLDSVAEQAGLHRSSVYRYFNSKEELITAVVVQATLRIGRAIIAEIGESAEPERFLVEGVTAGLAAVAADPVHRSLMAPSASEAMARIAGTAITEGIRPLIEPMFAAADERGVLRAGVTPDDAILWLQIVSSGMVCSPNVVPDEAQLRELLRRMLVPALIEQD